MSMFSALSKNLSKVFENLKGRGALSEKDVTVALLAVRVALLEADVALSVVKQLIDDVQKRAIGQKVLKSVTPGQMVVKIVYDHLVQLLGGAASSLNLNAPAPQVIMLVGLQGSGKTTTTVKIAKRLMNKHKKRVLMVSLDIYRPAAQQQLQILGKQTKIDTLPIVTGEPPLSIVQRAQMCARMEGYDVILLDTAGRLHVNTALMQELVDVKHVMSPVEILLVVDAMTGQDAVNIAKSFNESIGITGIVLTRADGTARGGVALSMKSVTGCPIKFIGVGEQADHLEDFHPERVAGRILGMGDVVSLVEKASDSMDEAEAEKLAKQIRKGKFDLGDMAIQLHQIGKMGGLSSIIKMLPGVGTIQKKIGALGVGNETVIKYQLAIIGSMTKKERRYPKLLNASRKVRVAQGSGVTIQEVNRLLKQYKDMQRMMKKINKLGVKGMNLHVISNLLR